MLVHSSCAIGVVVMESTIDDAWEGLGCFSGVQFGKGVVIGYYSDMLMYTNLYGDKNLKVRCEKVIMYVSVRNCRHALYSSEMVLRTAMEGIITLR